jgi:uncharacterized protein (TIGR03435 family)
MVEMIGDHLWQSTLVAALAALVVSTLRRNRAQVRYGVWLAASLKFLVPFAALTAVGQRLGIRPPALDVMRFDYQIAVLTRGVDAPFPAPALDAVSTPAAASVDPLLVASSSVLILIWLAGVVAVMTLWLFRRRRVAAIVEGGSPLDDPRVAARLERLQTSRSDAQPLRVVTADTRLEPGVFGIWRPVLIWPRGIASQLTDDQIEAILAHELCHLTRRDNLAAAVHTVVQALFWFHPLVWLIGARLIDERERACDEAVLHDGREPAIYAESILRTCQHSLEAPALCMAGVTGADLKRRMEQIMSHGSARALSLSKKALLAVVSAATVAAPIAAGILSGPPLRAQAPSPPPGEPLPSFEVASVKPNTSGENRVLMGAPSPDRMTMTNMSVREMIRQAYQVQPFQIFGGPDWIESQRFDVNAVMPKSATPTPLATRWLMLRSLLAERFNLGVHSESRDMPIYELVLARDDGRLGPSLRPAGDDCAPMKFPAGMKPPPPPPPPSPGAKPGPVAGPGCPMFMGNGFLSGRRTTIAALSRLLANAVRRTIVDKTGLDGVYDVDLEFTPEFGPLAPVGLAPPPGAAPVSDAPREGPSIFTAMQEQLGLKLESTRGPVEVIVIDRVDALIPD